MPEQLQSHAALCAELANARQAVRQAREALGLAEAALLAAARKPTDFGVGPHLARLREVDGWLREALGDGGRVAP